MILHHSVTVKEELINFEVLTKLVNNYCLNGLEDTVITPIEHVFIEINVINPETISVDLKPLIMEEVILAVSKIVKKSERQSVIDIPNSDAIAPFNSNNLKREYVAISSIDEINLIKMEDIMYCQADGKYTKFFLANGDSFFSCKNLDDYEHRILDLNHFFRIHNSYIVNMRFVARVDKRDGMSCELLNGLSIPISTKNIEGFNRFIRIIE